MLFRFLLGQKYNKNMKQENIFAFLFDLAIIWAKKL